MQMGFYFDQTRCNGCFTCNVACKDWHDIPAGPVNYKRVSTIEKGKYPDVSVAFLALSCCHCANPTCAGACPVEAITKREKDGVMVVDREKCLGKDSCGLCLTACPWEVPQFGAEENAKMQMCTFCVDRLEEGKNPICVDACPVYALDYGPMDELKKKYGEGKEGVGFAYSDENEPSMVVKARVKATVKK